MNHPNPFIYDRTYGADIRAATIPSLLPEQYSQCGEDMIVLSLLQAARANRTFREGVSYVVVEVGANHAFAGSNSYLLRRRLGLRSILVEANPALIDELKQARPEDQVVHAAIVDDDAKYADLCVAPSNELSSLSQGFVSSWHNGVMGKGQTVRVPAMRLNVCLAANVQETERIAFLSVDVEGKDLNVMRALDFARWHPLLVQLEPSEHFAPGETDRMVKFMRAWEYSLVAKTDVNLLFACARFFGVSRAAASDAAADVPDDRETRMTVAVADAATTVARDDDDSNVASSDPGEPPVVKNAIAATPLTCDPLVQWRIDESLVDRVTSAARVKDIVTIDVFDTALTRVKHESPVDVFAEVEQLLLKQVGRAGQGFALARETAERTARARLRKLTGAEEVTIDDIYEELPALMPDFVGCQLARQAELDVERATLRAVPDILELTRRLAQQGTPYAFVSDMYLPSNFLAGVLRGNGYRGWASITVSCEVGATKASGHVWSRVKSEFGEHVLHVGDDQESDVEKPRDCGVDSVYYARARSARRTTQKLDSATVVGSRLRRFLVLRSRGSGKDEDLVARWYRLGQGFGGLVVGAFISWLAEKIKVHQIDRLYFCARDGYLMKQAWDASGLAAKLGVETRYLHISRRALNIPAGIQVSTPEHLSTMLLDFLTGTFDNITVLQVLARCGVVGDPPALALARQVYGSDLNQTTVQWQHRDKLHELLQGMAAKIYRALAPCLEDCRGYLRQEGLCDRGRCAVVDMGWHGTLQCSLQELLTAAGTTASLEGFYYGLWPAASGNRYAAGSMQACFATDFVTAEKQAEVWFGVPFLEQLHSAAHGSTLRYERGEDDRYVPVFQESVAEVYQHREHTQYFQAGVLEMIRSTFGAVGSPLPIAVDELTPASGRAAMDALFLSPMAEEIDLLRRIGHCPDYDHATHKPILEPDLPTNSATVERVYPVCESKVCQLRLWLQRGGSQDVDWVTRLAYERLGWLGERVLRQFK